MWRLFASGSPRKAFLVLLLASTFSQLIPEVSRAEVVVASAGGFRQLVEDLVKGFGDLKGGRASATFGSSGKLFQQISAGAPFDVFVSAHPSWVDLLEKRGVKLLRRDWAEVDLVVWSTKEEFAKISSLLEGRGVYATVDPSVGPFGERAVEFLRSKGVYEGLVSKGKLIFLADLTRAVLAVRSGAVDGAVLGRTSVGGLEGSFEAIPGYRVLATVALLSDKPEARAFFDFMFSDFSRRLLKEMGASPLF